MSPIVSKKCHCSFGHAEKNTQSLLGNYVHSTISEKVKKIQIEIK